MKQARTTWNKMTGGRLLAAVLSLGCSMTMAQLPRNVTFTPFLTGTAQLPINKPLYFSEMPGKPGYFVVLEQHAGRVSVFHQVDSVWTRTVMDTVVFQGFVTTTTQSEMGLLGIAFHPRFLQNRKYYLQYNPNFSSSGVSGVGRTFIVERRADSSLIRRDTSVASRVLLSIGKPYSNHNGGTIDFGPKDGYLYAGIGDGGFVNDPGNRAQNLDSLQGKFLRIDVDTQTNGRQYGIPSDNPFVGTGRREEIYAYGARNPFKWSFDRDPATDSVKLWLGHVGERAWEWVSHVPKGANLGWDITEGSHCASGSGCSFTGVQPVILTYPHSPANTDSTGNCVIGGYVYRGNPASPFYGAYFYGDNGSNRVWAIRTNGTTVQERAVLGTLSSTTGVLNSFGTDHQGNLYVVAQGTNSLTATNGTIYKLSSPNLVPVSISSRRTGKAFAPQAISNLSGLKAHDLQGRKIPGSGAARGVYLVKRPGEQDAAFVPVLK